MFSPTLSFFLFIPYLLLKCIRIFLLFCYCVIVVVVIIIIIAGEP